MQVTRVEIGKGYIEWRESGEEAMRVGKGQKHYSDKYDASGLICLHVCTLTHARVPQHHPFELQNQALV